MSTEQSESYKGSEFCPTSHFSSPHAFLHLQVPAHQSSTHPAFIMNPTQVSITAIVASPTEMAAHPPHGYSVQGCTIAKAHPPHGYSVQGCTIAKAHPPHGYSVQGCTIA